MKNTWHLMSFLVPNDLGQMYLSLNKLNQESMKLMKSMNFPIAEFVNITPKIFHESTSVAVLLSYSMSKILLVLYHAFNPP